MVKKKKIFPKLKKKLKGFLTDESGKISKKDALGLAAGAVLLSGVEGVDAASPICSTPAVGHASGIVNGAYNVTPAGTSTATCTVGNISTAPVCTVTVNPVSGNINGHYSSVPTATVTASGHCSHASHASHGSHGSY